MVLTTSEEASLQLDGDQRPGRPEGEPEGKPVVVIERSRPWGTSDLRELWAYRELLLFLIWRDVKVRYKQTALGVAWVVVQPVVQMVIFTLLFGRLAGLDSHTGGVPYPLFAFAGLLPWTFFSAAVTNSGNSLVGSAHLITKVYFPRVLVPAAAVAAGLVDLLVSSAVMVALLAYYRVAPSWEALVAVPLLVLLTALLALGTGMLLSALNVKYRDIRHALPFAMQVWMFASPVIYPSALVPDPWRRLLALNPVAGVIEGLRAALFGGPFPWESLGLAAAVTLLLLVVSALVFRRLERSFADVI
jgi:lipopolysaccharide transport system permease protein